MNGESNKAKNTRCRNRKERTEPDGESTGAYAPDEARMPEPAEMRRAQPPAAMDKNNDGRVATVVETEPNPDRGKEKGDASHEERTTFTRPREPPDWPSGFPV